MTNAPDVPQAGLQLLHSFTGPTGLHPNAVAQARDGSLIGTTLAGGVSRGWGTVFRLQRPGQLSRIHSFTFADGSGPNSILIFPTGTVFGTTQGGGANGGEPGFGTVFTISKHGVLQTLHHFEGDSRSSRPIGLTAGKGGTVFGIAGGTPGTSDCGAVFEITVTHEFKMLHVFGGRDGAWPSGKLMHGAGDILYGMTREGGAFDSGVIYSLSPSGRYEIVHSFSPIDSTKVNRDGAYPVGKVVQGGVGELYGLTSSGGANGYGTMFKIRPGEDLSVIHNFTAREHLCGDEVGFIKSSTDSFFGSCCSYKPGSSDYSQFILFELTTKNGAKEILRFDASSEMRPPSIEAGPDGVVYITTYGGYGSSRPGRVYVFDTRL